MTDAHDITEGLDLLGDWLDAKGYTEEAGLCTRAMDEINRLREARDECERQYQEQVNKVGDVLEERNILRAENARLREALKPFARSVGPETDMIDDTSLSASIFTFGQLRAARAAMGEME